MQAFELSADFAYCSLITDGDDSALIDSGMFIGNAPIGDRWVPRKVVYYEETAVGSVDACEGALSPKDFASNPDGKKGNGDFPFCWGGINFGVLNRRSFDALHDLIRPFVEFLPLIANCEQFTAFKVLRFVDGLDHSKSVIDWYPQLKKDHGRPLHVREVRRYEFVEGCLDDEVIFRIPELPVAGTPVFVTDRFVAAVQQHELAGFKFTQIWPHVDPRAEIAKKAREKRQRRGSR